MALEIPLTDSRSASPAVVTARPDPKWFKSARFRDGPIPSTSSNGEVANAAELSPIYLKDPAGKTL